VIRVVAYNVNGAPDVDALGEVLSRLEPRIVCLVERPSSRRMRRVGRAAGLEVAARTGRRGTGTALLVHPDVGVRTTSVVPLTTPRDVPSREAVHAIVSVGGLRLSVAALQLGLRPEVRRHNLDELTSFLDRVDAPTVIGCDLNESARAPVASALAAAYQDAHAVAGAGSGDTYPTSDPSTRQDYVFVDRELTVLGCHVPDGAAVGAASHHRPVVVDLAGREDAATRLDRDEERSDASAA